MIIIWVKTSFNVIDDKEFFRNFGLLRSLFFILFFFVTKFIFAQTFFVGDTSCNYLNVNYSFNITFCPGWQPQLKTYFIDINGDFNSDIDISSYCLFDPGSGGSASDNKRIFIRSNTGYEFGHGTSVLSPCGQPSVIKNYSYGTILNAGLNWSVTSTSIPYGGSDLYYWHNDLIIPSASYTCGLQTNPFYVAFRKKTTTDTIYGWISINSFWPGNIMSYGFKRTPLLQNAAFTNTLSTVCAGSTLALNANLPGGLFIGSVTGNIFSSNIAGTFPVYYTNGCTIADTLLVTVNPLPTPVFTNSVQTICYGDSLQLYVSPPGGIITGGGVIGNTFYSVMTGPGNKSVYYTYTNSSGCTKTSSMVITVSIPTIAISSSYPLSCAGQSVTLIANGASTYSWSTGANNTTSVIVNPSVTTNYTVTGADSFGCKNQYIYSQNVGTPTVNVTAQTSNSLLCPGQTATLTANGAVSYTWNTSATTQNILVNPNTSTNYTVIGALTIAGGCSNSAVFNQPVGSPTVSATTNTSNICKGDWAVLISSGAAASYLWNTGTTTPNCTVFPNSTTTYSLVASNPGGCSDTAFVTVIVAPTLSINAVSSHSILCAGDTATLTMSGATYYNGFNSTQSVGFLVWTNTVQINPTVTDTYTIIGTSIINSCEAEGYFTQIVSACVGINELANQENYFRIFPNPSNGEFEIRGIKEEIIFITNELGQLIDTKYLKLQNNYSVKTDNLPSGVYFVGNNLSRQKVVVIK